MFYREKNIDCIQVFWTLYITDVPTNLWLWKTFAGLKEQLHNDNVTINVKINNSKLTRRHLYKANVTNLTMRKLCLDKMSFDLFVEIGEIMCGPFICFSVTYM